VKTEVRSMSVTRQLHVYIYAVSENCGAEQQRAAAALERRRPPGGVPRGVPVCVRERAGV
jgi:hypothetical protein